MYVLIGGGDIRAKETIEIDKQIAKLAKEKAERERGEGARANALFVGTASHDYMPYNNSFHKMYTGELGLKTDVVLTVYTQMDEEKIKGKFEKADMIYVGGGDTVFLIEEWRRAGLDERIAEARARGVIVAGLSAGAICWFEKMYTDSAKTGEDVYTVVPGLGVLPGAACPHYNHRRADFAEVIGEGEDWTCMEDNSALILDDDGKILRALNLGGQVYKVRKENGKIIETPIR